ncbi:MFS transporter [Hydrogenophaga sp.]|uniref:MFS transporter n=1 Tax=Hydrogenophaga sp. TaxID=1904254 RepID=UPI002619B590|nr:MFS transporter [Hydrogenophaga sp.]MCW5653794.1 MFS transporter [Hydrogenophaga sp.]
MAVREIGSSIPLRLIGLLVLGHVAFAGGRFTLTLQAVALQASPAAIGLVMGLLMVVPMFLAVRIGRWSDTLGFMKPASAGLAMGGAGALLAAWWPGIPVLCVASVLIGTGYMLAHVAVNNAIGQQSRPEELTRAFSWLAMGFSVSGLVGPLMCGLAIDHLGYRAAFTLAAVCSLASLYALASMRQGQAVRPRVPAGEARRSVVDLLRHPPLRAVFVVSGLLSMGWDLFSFLVPLHGARSGLSATAIGLLMGAFGVGTFVIRIFLPYLSAGPGQWRTLRWALFVTAVGYLLFPMADSFAAMLPASFALGLALGCGQPMAMNLLHVTAPAGRAGEAVGVRSTLTSASQTFLPLVFGALGAALGVGVMFWIGAVVLAGGGVYAGRHR